MAKGWAWWIVPAALCVAWTSAVRAKEPGSGDGSTAQLSPEDTMEVVVAKAASVRPSARQLAWQEVELATFLCFGVDTYTDREWGEGTEDPAIFNPTEFDARELVRQCKAFGIETIVFLAKHHDGFCLWPSAYTEHSVKKCPWREGKGDMVREIADACRDAGIRLSLYLSPWDRHEPSYGDSPAYNAFFKNQLRELLANYGEIADVWFDGACGEGPNGKRQEYDWDGYFALIRELQPNATISICGPDVRWCGNEAGDTRASEWSVVPENFVAEAPDLGSREQLAAAAKQGVRLKWSPAQVDTSIRPGWFYHAGEDDKVKPLDKLLDIYYGSVGGNAQLLLNLPLDRRGKIHENDARRMTEFRTVLDATFDEDLARGAKATASCVRGGDAAHGADKIVDGDAATFWATDDGATSASLEIDLGKPAMFNRVSLQEYLPWGQHIESFAVDAFDGADWREIARGTTVGHKRLLRCDDVTASRVRVRILESRVAATLSAFGLYRAPDILQAPSIARDAQGRVSLEAAPGVEIRYWLSTWPASATSKRYGAPFAFGEGGTVKAVAIRPDTGDHVATQPGLMNQAAFEALPEGGKNEPPADIQEKWEDFPHEDGFTPVARVNDDFPLSDQQDTGHWTKFEPFCDEFEGNAIDAGRWWGRNPTWLGRQPALFCPHNVEVRDGKLNLTMRKEEPPEERRADGFHTFTSAAVQSKRTVRYGYFEIEAKAMPSAGSSAFWFYDATPPWWTEIDVFEIGSKAPKFERKVHMTVHVMKTPAEERHSSAGGAFTAPVQLHDDYHVYGLEWDERELKFYFDGVLVRRGVNTQWHQPLTLNFDSETMPEWFGLPDEKDLPSTYSIEYVRAWKNAKE